jgi:hypothetical protein
MEKEVAMARKLAWCAALFVVLSPHARAAEWVFYEGNFGTQNIVCTLDQAPMEVHLGGIFSDPYGCDNDEARSVRLLNVPAGAMLGVFDDGGCSKNDDYTRIQVLQNISDLTIGSFEGGTYPSSINFQHVHNNGLDGKVSCVQISLCGDSVCTAGEDYYLCPADCSDTGTGGGGGGGTCPPGQCCGTNCASDCGNGSCEYMQGECDSTCPQDCSGVYCQ